MTPLSLSLSLSSPLEDRKMAVTSLGIKMPLYAADFMAGDKNGCGNK